MNILIINLVNTRDFPKVSMTGVLDLHNLTTLRNVVYATEERVHILESNLPGLGDEENYEDCETDVYSGEEEECIAMTVSIGIIKMPKWTYKLAAVRN
jgi:hypothetical protein